MARARNIKPGFFKNEDLAECDPFARLCFAGLWTIADRDGRLEDRPKRIKGELFAYDSVEVDPLLEQLARRGFIARYEVDGMRVIQILKFAKHQNPHHREAASVLPAMPGFVPDAPENDEKPGVLNSSHDGKALGQPEASPGQALGSSLMEGGSSRAESLFSDSLIPSSQNPDSLPSSPDLPSEGQAGKVDPVGKRSAKAKAPPVTAETWSSYSTAYEDRYGIAPARNAMVNGQLANLVKQLGAEEAPQVASFYVRHEDAFYVRKAHPISLLVTDAQKLRMEWITGRTTSANSQESLEASNRAVAARFLKRSRHTGFDQVDYEEKAGL
jgi:hypothetical protein